MWKIDHEIWWRVYLFPVKHATSGDCALFVSLQIGSFKKYIPQQLGSTVAFVHLILSARCFSLFIRLVAVTQPRVRINDKKGQATTNLIFKLYYANYFIRQVRINTNLFQKTAALFYIISLRST
jgi:hypothetical protein